MSSNRGEEAEASEGETVAENPEDHLAEADRSSAADPNFPSAGRPDRPARGEWVGSVLVADPSTIVSGVGQSQYQHFAIEVGADGQPVELGRGAMGVTYRAIDTTLQRAVALKVIATHLIDNDVLKSRFIREARAAASLRHPNVASVFYLGATESSYFYAMELVTGETLEQFIAKKGPLDPILALDITAQVTSALVAANQAGLVHRDIKPANLILTRDEKGGLLVKVVDFGLVKMAAEQSDDADMSDPGTFLGTPRYASPEQFSGGKIDIRSDLYALGITLWQMLTKATPFKGMPTQVAAQHLQSPPPIGELRHLPHPIVSLLTHLLEKNPDNRPQTPEELLAMLSATRRAIGGQAGTFEGMPPRLQPKRWPLRIGKSAYLVAALVVLIAGAAVFIRFPSHLMRDPKSVAVLPFDSVGDDGQNAYLSDGFTSEVIFQLSKIADLRVISRDSVLRYKATPTSDRKPLRKIADELEVATLLESNIQRLADRLKVRSVLYDANSGKQLWSQSYDREMNDLFAIQSDVAESIAAALQAKLSSDERDNIQRSPTQNMNAYDLYLRGKESFELRRKDDNENAIALFKQAIDQDPNFALAYAGLANCYIERKVRFDGEPFWLDSAIDLCRKAITVDPKQARAYNVLARAMWFKNRPIEARDAVAKAIELAPNDKEANFRAAVQLPYSSLEKYTLFLKCRSLDPNDAIVPYNLGYLCVFWEDNQLRDWWLHRAIHLENNEERKRLIVGEQLVYQKNYQAALDKLQPLSPKLVAYGPYVEDLKCSCWEHLGQWTEVLNLVRSTKDIENERWPLLHLILALNATHQESDAQQKAKRLLALAKETVTDNADDRYAEYFLAFCYRFLGEKDQAYSYLRRIFPEVIGRLPLGRDDYSLRIFSQDREMQELLADFEKTSHAKREQLHQMDNSL
jgi:TolB-like protein/tRNA A-37 threonylcarbamoyl transferase component Bud32